MDMDQKRLFVEGNRGIITGSSGSRIAGKLSKGKHFNFQDKNDTISHIVSECKSMTQNEYKKWRQDKVTIIIPWELYKKYGF